MSSQVVSAQGQILNIFSNITSFHTYNEFDGVKTFYRIQHLVSFRGNGESGVCANCALC